MFKSHSYTLFLSLVLGGGILFPFALMAQTGNSGGAIDPVSPMVPVATSEASVATSTPIPPSRGTPIPMFAPTSPVPRATSSAATPAPLASPRPENPVSPAPQNSADGAASSEKTPLISTEPIDETPDNFLLLAGFAVLVLLPFGYLLRQMLKNKKVKEEKKDKSGCFDIKKLLDDKLKELTDIKGQIEGRVTDSAKNTLRDSLKGTPVGNTFVLLEKAEEEYQKLKKLYEECSIEFEKKIFKGTIVENNLSDKDILNNVTIKKTYRSDVNIFHDILANEEEIREFAKHMAEGPWYVLFCAQGKDDARVVFKDKIFAIKFSDTNTWSDAVSYGKSVGVEEKRLDFKREADSHSLESGPGTHFF